MDSEPIQMINPMALARDVAARSAEAALGRLRLSNVPLREHLRTVLSRAPGEPGSFLASPVIEAAFGYKTAPETLSDLVLAGLLDETTVSALAETRPLEPTSRASRNTLPVDLHPYVHQLTTWRLLAEEPPNCVVVSSGTGSGKTEAFLVPILDQLARKTKVNQTPGVRALFLYPLNALIASQRDRLADWSAPFGGHIRFSLYNGETPEHVSDAVRRERPYEAIDRAQLRAAPPQILVTNATMLEYMLVRDKDVSILSASRGKLGWIVLDEAHSYLGSQAAEMTLLLRRTLHAFGVTAEQVRFIATSATLGGGVDDQETGRKLRTFLARMAGVSEERVHVVLGQRHVPLIDQVDSELADNPSACALRQRVAAGPATLDELRQANPGLDVEAMLLAGAASKVVDGSSFLPLRTHMFHRAQAGVFACMNDKCPGKSGTPLDKSEWPFGMVFERDRAKCSFCDSMTLEVLVCDECGLPALDASLDAAAEELHRWHASTPADEFATDAELPDAPDLDEEENECIPSERVILRPETSNIGLRTLLDPQTGRLHDSHKEGLVSYRRLEHAMCPSCGAGRAGFRPFRSLRLGGPFFSGVAGNVLLDEMPARNGPRRLPSNGRQLITFTDDRQGTARFAASWQQERERSFARARIWHQIQNRDTGGDEIVDAEIKAYEALPTSALSPPLLARLKTLQVERAARLEGKPTSWSDMQACLARLNDAEPELIGLWRDRDAEFTTPEAIARLQLLTEFLRRPLRANSLETMGLAALKFPALERQSGANIPDLFKEHGASIEDWRDFLHVVLTYFVRANSAVSITSKQALWLGQKVRPRRYLPWGVQRDLEGRREQRWPRLGGLSGRNVRPVLILRDAFGLDLESPYVRESVNEVLEAAWRAFSAVSAKGLPDNALQLDLTLGEVVPVGRAWLCPVTGRIMERVFRGLTPYVTQAPQRIALLTCESLTMPSLPFPWLTDHQGKDERAETIDWLKRDPSVVELRSRGLWTDIADRLALLTPFARIVEHSAQQSSTRLREYETRFKRGEINVLNCSTTMEMGVDIGGLVGVAMANVPPSPANYRQRVGRAGRRGEAVAVAFTYCSDTPLGWHTFDRPRELLSRAIAPPSVALEGVVLALRHVNAMLLGAFFRSRASQPLKLTAGAFFDHNATEAQAPWRQFVDWLAADIANDPTLLSAIRGLAAGTGLAGALDLPERSAAAINVISERWLTERRQLQNDFDAVPDGPARRAIKFQSDRMDGEFLLGELVRQAFLPGHGFPTDVAPFVVPAPPRDSRSETRREDAGGRGRGYPTRTLDVALREYAPGADVVLDGVVYRSGGVTLNWKRPVSDEAVSEIQAIRWLWRCRRCDAGGDDVRRPETCPACSCDALDRVRALRPAGFAADPAVERTNAVEYVEFVPPQLPLVSARGAVWVALENPSLGRSRRAPDGLVMTVSRGAGGEGYAVCLACGRAAPETSAEGPLPMVMSGHRSLRRGALRCDGSVQPFAIQRHLAFGHSRRTEVFELQLAGLTEKLATTVVIALREALCRTLGIERDEVSWGIGAVQTDNSSVISLFLFDTAAGGAGYAGAASTSISTLVREARSVLDCSNPGCERACPACLILRDTARVADRLDRGAAAEWIDELLNGLTLPEDARAFPGAIVQHVAASPLPNELARAVARTPDAVLSFVLHGLPEDWNLREWWASELIELTARKGTHIQLIASLSAIKSASLGTVLELRAICDRAGSRLSIHGWDHPPSPKGLLATISKPGRSCQAWALAGGKPASQSCPILPPEAVIYGSLPLPVPVRPALNLDAHLRGVLPDARRMEVRHHLDGEISSFGRRFWELICQEPGMTAALRDCMPIESLSYEDRYLFAPVAARLLHSTISEFLSLVGQNRRNDIPIQVRTMHLRPKTQIQPPTGWRDDWPDTTKRNLILENLMRQVGAKLALEVRARADTQHARTLRIEGGGKFLSITLDQGFGFWQPVKRVPFDFEASAESQVAAMLRTKLDVRGESGQSTLIYIQGSPSAFP